MTELRRRWQKFVQQTQPIADRTGLPLSVLTDHRLFDYFLMHGCSDRDLDPTYTTMEQLDAEQRHALEDLIVAYLAAGFGDPGLAIFSNDQRAELHRRVAAGHGTRR